MKKVRCSVCGRIEEVENAVPGTNCPNCSSQLIRENAKMTGMCIYCEKDILPHEVSIFCSECGTEYHSDCWLDNDGCGIDGCPNQDCLAPMEIPLAASAPSQPSAASLNLGGSESTASEESGNVESEDEDDVFEIKAVPQTESVNRQSEDALIEEKMAAMRRREQAPEEKKISWKDVMDWKNTPRDTKYDFDGPWIKDPYLFQKLKNYMIFAFGGLMGGAVMGVSLIVLFMLLKFLVFHSGISFGFMVFLLFVGLAGGVVSGVYFAYRTMASLIDN